MPELDVETMRWRASRTTPGRVWAVSPATGAADVLVADYGSLEDARAVVQAHNAALLDESDESAA